MPHICVSELDQLWFRWWLVAYSAPSHYLNQCWVIVNWTLRNESQWNFNQNAYLFIHEDASENIVCEMAPFCPMGDELITRLLIIVLECSPHKTSLPSILIQTHLRIIFLLIAVTHLKSPATRLFVWQLVQATNKENIKYPHCLLYVREIHRWPCS